MKARIFFSLLLLISLVGFHATAQTYTDCSDEEFSSLQLSSKVLRIDDDATIQLPEGWTKVKTSPGAVVLNYGSTGIHPGTINVAVQKDPSFAGITAYDLSTANIFVEAGATEESIFEARQFSHKGIPALYVHYTTDGFDAQQMAVIHKGKIYMLTMMGEEGYGICFYDIFNAVRGSLAFK